MMNKQLLVIATMLVPLVGVTPSANAAMNHQGSGGWRTSDGAGGWVQNDNAENRFDIGIDACKQACEDNNGCRGVEYISAPNGWEEEGRTVHNKCEIHRDPYAHCDRSIGAGGSTNDGCWVKEAVPVVGGDSCQPYFEEMFAAGVRAYAINPPNHNGTLPPHGIAFKVHGTKMHYEGNTPQNWRFSVLLNQRDAPNLSDENDHFMMYTRSSGLSATGTVLGIPGEVYRIEGYYREDKSKGNAEPKAFTLEREGFLSLTSPIHVYVGYNFLNPMQVKCYSINDNPDVFAIKGTGGEVGGEWVYTDWLFSVEKVSY